MITVVYGTRNEGKMLFMREVFEPLNVRLLGLGDFSLRLPEIDERGNDPLQNAKIKALAYRSVLQTSTAFDYALFSCDSGLYIDGLSDAEQSAVHIRRVLEVNLSDEEMIHYYSSLAARLGGKANTRPRHGGEDGFRRFFRKSLGLS